MQSHKQEKKHNLSKIEELSNKLNDTLDKRIKDQKELTKILDQKLNQDS